MKRLILILSLAAAALSGCAQLSETFHNAEATGGSTGVEQTRPYPKSASDLGLF